MSPSPAWDSRWAPSFTMCYNCIIIIIMYCLPPSVRLTLGVPPFITMHYVIIVIIFHHHQRQAHQRQAQHHEPHASLSIFYFFYCLLLHASISCPSVSLTLWASRWTLPFHFILLHFILSLIPWASRCETIHACIPYFYFIIILSPSPSCDPCGHILLLFYYCTFITACVYK